MAIGSRHFCSISKLGWVQKILLLRLRFCQKASAKCAAEILAVFITFRKLLNGVAWYGMVTAMMIVVIMTMTMISENDDRDDSYGDRMMDNEDIVVDINILTIVYITYMGFDKSQSRQFRSICCQHLGC